MTTKTTDATAIDLSEVLLKVLGPNGESIHGGSGTWHLPKGKRAGAWMLDVDGPVRACHNGYHLTKLSGFHEWTREGCTVYLAEGRGDQDAEGHKIAFRQARLIRRLNWDDRIARVFAADCAERVLPIFERDRPTDKRPRMSVEVARRFAAGQATPEELAAARDGAWAAAWDGAWAAAWAAARDAAWAAARAAARAAAWDARTAAWAAGAAAGDAELKWQTELLIKILGGKY